VTALDTSVCVPALVSWHEHHQACRQAAVGARVPAHVLVESFSVLTRLPAPHRLTGDVARRLLSGRFTSSEVLTESAALQRSIVDRLARLGVEGGAVYDALVGLTAAQHAEVLLTRDRRATRTYELVGATFRLVEA
jgi:predicted nucleic acid-binding protein